MSFKNEANLFGVGLGSAPALGRCFVRPRAKLRELTVFTISATL
jgi:hypothetical protein